MRGYYYRGNDGDGIIGCGCLLVFLLLAIGYILNFQNLWQYWPDTQTNTTVLQWLSELPVRWIVSLIGVFLFPIGIVTGWIW